MSSGRDGPAVFGKGGTPLQVGKNKYKKIKKKPYTSAAFVLMVGIFKVFGKHISGSYSSLIPILKENKLKYKALNYLLSCLVQFPLLSVGVRPLQLEAGSFSPLQFNNFYYCCQVL